MPSGERWWSTIGGGVFRFAPVLVVQICFSKAALLRQCAQMRRPFEGDECMALEQTRRKKLGASRSCSLEARLRCGTRRYREELNELESQRTVSNYLRKKHLGKRFRRPMTGVVVSINGRLCSVNKLRVWIIVVWYYQTGTVTKD